MSWENYLGTQNECDYVSKVITDFFVFFCTSVSGSGSRTRDNFLKMERKS